MADLPGIPESVREARTIALKAIGVDHPAADATTVCVSELVTNALKHTLSGCSGTIALYVTPVGASQVYVRVIDAGGGKTVPSLADPEPDAEHGRGLNIIAALSLRWGWWPTAKGRATWCWIEGS
jgi:anti-sigma regulatory factor (Ser/Thr protein kinase)